MKRGLLLLCALLFAAAALADMEPLTNYRLGNTLVTVGDDIGKVTGKLGKADRVIELTNAYGATLGWRYEYDKYRRGPIHFFVISDGHTIGNIYR